MNTDEEAAGLRIRAQAGIGIPHGDNELTRALLAVLDERDTQAARIVQLEKKMASDHAQYLDFVSSSAAEIGRLEKYIVHLRERVSTLESEQQAALAVICLDNAPSDRGQMIIASLKALYSQATNQAARIRELEEALRFFAEDKHLIGLGDDGEGDGGKMARQALGQKEETGSDG